MLTNFLSNRVNLFVLHIIILTIIVFVIGDYVETMTTKFLLIGLLFMNNFCQHLWGVSQGIVFTTINEKKFLEYFEKLRKEKNEIQD